MKPYRTQRGLRLRPDSSVIRPFAYRKFSWGRCTHPLGFGAWDRQHAGQKPWILLALRSAIMLPAQSDSKPQMNAAARSPDGSFSRN